VVISACDQVWDAIVCPLVISLLPTWVVNDTKDFVDESQKSVDERRGGIQGRRGHTVNPNIGHHPHDYRYNHNSDPIHQLPPWTQRKDGRMVETDIKEESPFTTFQTP
jgi:hypothetical protein